MTQLGAKVTVTDAPVELPDPAARSEITLAQQAREAPDNGGGALGGPTALASR